MLLLREGAVVAQGPIEITLTAENLSATFGMPLELEVRGTRYAGPSPLSPQENPGNAHAAAASGAATPDGRGRRWTG